MMHRFTCCPFRASRSGATLALVASVLAFLAFQRQLVQGHTSGAIKG